MKKPLSRIALIAIMAVACSPFAHADNETFPDLGKAYNVSFAENARQSNGQIKIIRKGEGSWIFVEFTTKVWPPPRVATPGTPQPAPEEPKTFTKKLWLNTQWIVSASEPEGEKK